MLTDSRTRRLARSGEEGRREDSGALGWRTISLMYSGTDARDSWGRGGRRWRGPCSNIKSHKKHGPCHRRPPLPLETLAPITVYKAILCVTLAPHDPLASPPLRAGPGVSCECPGASRLRETWSRRVRSLAPDAQHQQRHPARIAEVIALRILSRRLALLVDAATSRRAD